MKCQVFELVVVDLARSGAPLDDRSGALEHAEGCERCRARLEAERVLSAELRALEAADAGLEAPPRLEADLRAAFRELAAPPAVAVTRRNGGVSLAAAAAVATLLGGALVYRAAVATKRADQPAVPPRTAGVKAVTEPRKPDLVAPAVEPPSFPQSQDRGVRKASHTTAPRRAEVVNRDPVPREIATGYYSLVGGGEVVPRDGWQIVRVEVPRASLAALGFAVNPARAAEPITADVMLGHDGVARAIRFVQTTDSAERRYR